MDPNRRDEVELYKAYTIDEVLERRELLTSSSGTDTRTDNSYYTSLTNSYMHYFFPGAPV
jgi:hypothetical protein